MLENGNDREVDSEFCSSCCIIPWGHIMYLLDKTEPNASRAWYVQAVIDNGWSRAVLAHQVESHLYERQALSGTVNNFSRTLPEDYRDVLPSPEDLRLRI